MAEEEQPARSIEEEFTYPRCLLLAWGLLTLLGGVWRGDPLLRPGDLVLVVLAILAVDAVRFAVCTRRQRRDGSGG